jgi:uncharacterized repeat protein (TIGR03943 family)
VTAPVREDLLGGTERDVDERSTTERAGVAALLCALVGITLLRLVWSGVFRRYVRGNMAVWLVIAGVVLVAASAITWWRGRTATDRQGHDHDGPDHDGHDHDGHEHDGHAHASRIGWLLLVPVLVLFLVAPPGLGSYALGRALATSHVRAGAGTFRSLVGPGPVEMLLKEFDERAYDRDGASFAGVPVRVVGFVGTHDASGFVVARFQIACCAADGVADFARIVGFGGVVPARDTWVEVTGVFEPGAGPQQPPHLRPSSVVPVAVPGDPYEPN